MAETLISPGVLARENDHSFVSATPAPIGAAIVGPTLLGKVGIPKIVTTYSDYLQNFGGYFISGGSTYNYLTALSAYNYFNNGGTSLLVTRVASGSFTPAASSNVSGSTTMTGSLILSSSNATELFVIGDSQFTGSVKVASTFQLQLPTGSNQQAGTAVLDGANPGTVTVSNSLVTANSIIMLTKQTLNHTNGYVAVSAKSAGSFTITSNHNGDADTVGWFIINNS